ncbi:MAG: DUF1003 domain-containing protein [Bacteroidetes bacterium]|nr:DUF1003 domain-containing protein [Bacteroidota bacterium]
MNGLKEKTIICPVCKNTRPAHEALHGELIQPVIVKIIKQSTPGWDGSEPICFSCLNSLRADHLQELIHTQKGKISDLEKEVTETLRKQELLSSDLNAAFDKELSFGSRLADKVAAFGGSWKFIILFSGIIILWISANSIAYFSKSFDPYPFILLNLVLSCIAALQAPVIMMSQNRQEAKDRMRSENDFKTNLKAELEVRILHQKMDELLTHHWNSLMNIQKMQIEMMEKIMDAGNKQG